MLIFVLLLEIISACKSGFCNADHSTYFKENWRGNNPGDFFITLPYSDECEHIENDVLRKEFPKSVIDKDIDHIIELQNDWPEYEHCDKKIRGNMVAAVISWNRGVGNLCCKYTDAEKETVYGARYTIAKEAVIRCCQRGRTSNIVIIVIVFVIIMVAFGAYAYKNRREEADDQEEQSILY